MYIYIYLKYTCTSSYYTFLWLSVKTYGPKIGAIEHQSKLFWGGPGGIPWFCPGLAHGFV
jgi:hypothetical protein